MTENRPTVSLYIPAYNAALTLPKCLDSVLRMSVRPDEVIVVDDGSTDETARISDCRGVTLLRHDKNRGLAAARNTAVMAARGELVASLDSDLVAARDWLSRLLRNFQGRRRIAGCCGRVIEGYTDTIADRWRAVHMKLGFGLRRSYSPRWLYCGISLIRREALLEAGLFNERCRTAYDDVDMSHRLREHGCTLLYDPKATATHLKRSRPDDVVRGFWSYWAAKNEMQGSYRSLAAATRLMIERQMGIASYRIGQDLRHRRDELLPLDLLVPLTFCVRDLDEMARVGTLRRQEADVLQGHLAQRFEAIGGKRLPGCRLRSLARLAFAAGRVPETGRARLQPAHGRYLKAFETHFDRIGNELPGSAWRRVSENLAALLPAAGGEALSPGERAGDRAKRVKARPASAK